MSRKLLLLALTCGCADPEWAAPPPRDGLIEAAVAPRPPPGAALWAAHCRICHGDTGKGDGFNAGLLASRPPPAVALAPRLGPAELAQAIRGGSLSGGRSPQCPPWGALLGEVGVRDVATYLRQLGRVQ